MNAYLTQLGVPPRLQTFFAAEELYFDYGNEREHVSATCHRVPTTSMLWTAGSPLAKEVIITFSVMEAIAFMTINQWAFQQLDNLFFVAIGNRIHTGQMKWIRDNLKKRTFTLVFGDDLLGRLTDVKVALAIRNKEVKLEAQPGLILARLKQKAATFEEGRWSLSAFENEFSIRTKVRTCKPVNQLSFFDQLKHDTSK
jgi:hypothetical protein